MRHVSAHDDLHAVAGADLVRLFDGRRLTRVERELDQSVQLIGDIVQVRQWSAWRCKTRDGATSRDSATKPCGYFHPLSHADT